MPRRLVITKAGSPSVLDVIDMPMPTPNEGEVCIEVHYAGINFADTLMRLGSVSAKTAISIHSRLRSKWNNPFTWQRSHRI